MKKGVAAGRRQIARALMGLPARGRPKGSRTRISTKRGKHSIPQPWRDLDNGCLEFALNELPDENPDERFVSRAARRARFLERRGDYKIMKLSGRSTGPRRPRTHEQRVRQRAKELMEEVNREAAAKELMEEGNRLRPGGIFGLGL
jgi:hypothetical protein